MSLRLFCSALCGALLAGGAVHATEPLHAAILFENVRIFDGKGSALSAPSSVLVEGNLITRISQGGIKVEGEVQRIDGQGKTLMPGLIDAHTHLMFATLPQIAVLTNDVTFTTVAATRAANDMLMRGFTSARDLGGPVFGLKKGIDMGLINGPRIWPAGAMISQSGGHGDFRLPNELPALAGQYSFGERANAAMVADSPDAVRQRTREQLALGASQIKVMAGGVIIGTFAATFLAAYLKSAQLALFFAIFMAYVSIQMAIDKKPKPSRELSSSTSLFSVGSLIGIVSALVSIGGGSLTVPYLIWQNVDLKKAIATSAAIGFPLSIAGTVGYIVNGMMHASNTEMMLGFVYLPGVVLISIMSYFTAPFGAKMAHRLPVGKLKKIFALLLMALSLKMLSSVL